MKLLYVVENLNMGINQLHAVELAIGLKQENVEIVIASEGGVLERDGHTEATIDLMRLAGLNPAGVLCEITLPNGTMARMPDVIEFSKEHDMPVVTIEDIIQYRKENNV